MQSALLKLEGGKERLCGAELQLPGAYEGFGFQPKGPEPRARGLKTVLMTSNKKSPRTDGELLLTYFVDFSFFVLLPGIFY